MAVAGQHTSAEVSLEQLGSPAQMRTQGGSLDSLLGWGEGCNWAPPPPPPPSFHLRGPFVLKFQKLWMETQWPRWAGYQLELAPSFPEDGPAQLP